jgi:hypothetical protein
MKRKRRNGAVALQISFALVSSRFGDLAAAFSRVDAGAAELAVTAIENDLNLAVEVLRNEMSQEVPISHPTEQILAQVVESIRATIDFTKEQMRQARHPH